MWDAATGRQLTEPLEHRGAVLTARFSPDGRRIVTASQDRTACLWDAETGLALSNPMVHYDWVLSAGFSGDGARVLTASHDKTARIWPVHQAAAAAPQWLPDLAEIVGGRKLDSQRLPRIISWNEYSTLRARLLAQPPSDPYTRLAHDLLRAP